MATKKQNEIENQDPEVVIETAINTTEEFLFKNGKTLLVALAALIVIVGGYFSYKYLYQAPRSEKAAAMMFVAEQNFAADSIELALNGGAKAAGFVDVVSSYGSTASGNLAKHYAGVCYIKLGENDKALASLKSYNATKGVPNQIIAAQNYGLQGDIYSQKEDFSSAISLYKKAVDASDNNFTAPIYLYKMVLVYMAMDKNDKALEAAKLISEKYPQSSEGRDIQKVIGQLEQK